MDKPPSKTFGELLNKLKRTLIDQRVVVLPDFFVDVIVPLKSTAKTLSQIKSKLAAGGGSIRGVPIYEIKGGNAVNIAYALGKLEAPTTLVTMASGTSKNLLKKAFSSLRTVEISVVEGREGRTVSLEFLSGRRRVNVMLGDVADIAYFDSSKLNEYAWRRIEEADIVAVTNWAANMEGTQLAEAVFEKTQRHAKTFIAPADISERGAEFAAFLENISGRKLLDIVSLNSNEASVLGKAGGLRGLSSDFSIKEVGKLAAELSLRYAVRFDIHTTKGAVTALKGEASSSPAYKVKQKTATGAGDVWDAADILGYLLKLKEEERLALANCCAALYVSEGKQQPPSRIEAASFLSSIY